VSLPLCTRTSRPAPYRLPWTVLISRSWLCRADHAGRAGQRPPRFPRDGRPQGGLPPDRSAGTGGGSLLRDEVGERDVKDVGDALQRGHGEVLPGLDSLQGPPAHPGRNPDVVLGEVLTFAFRADAGTDSPAVVGEPVIVVGQVSHPPYVLVILH
jgi:hypothetical protein